MKKEALVFTLGLVLFAVVISMGVLITGQAQWNSGGSTAQGGTVEAGEYRLSGPYTHKNLSIFLVHGKNLIKAKSFLTLQEALVQKKLSSTRRRALTSFRSRIFRMKMSSCNPVTSSRGSAGPHDWC